MSASAIPDFFRKVKNVIIVASSSRGGSSLLAEILKRSPELFHFQGEINPFLTAAGIARPDSDQLTAEDAGPQRRSNLAELERIFSLEAGNPAASKKIEGGHFGQFKNDVARRLSAQWPEVHFPTETIARSMPREFTDASLFLISLLKNLRAEGFTLNPYYYDLDRELLKKHFPDVQPDYGPPSASIVEEPPFIVPAPWQPADAEALLNRALVIKTSSNVYRLPFLQKLFPEARLRILHLSRNPAASINGLYDGWRHHGFFSRRVARQLDIAGYTDHFPDWAKRWWKFDLPPGWEKHASAPLEKVCAFQWSAAHRAVMDFTEAERPDAFRLRFEDIAGPEDMRTKRLQDLAEWLGVDGKALLRAAEGMKPVMATQKPGPRRWTARKELLEPVLSDPDVMETSQRLGYGDDRAQWL